MALVEYGSSDSEQEQQRPAAPPKSKQTTSTKPAFEKLVDKSNPGKIRVNLVPEPSKASQEDATEVSEPPAKRAKTGTLGGFNSLLPAPKRTANAKAGLGKGINLKTGAAPGFTRETMPETSSFGLDQEESSELKMHGATAVTARSIDEKGIDTSDAALLLIIDDLPKKKYKIFKPLSVTRKSQKKNPAPTEGQSPATSIGQAAAPQPKSAAKLSLFSVGDVSDRTHTPSNATGAYQPLVYQPDEPSKSDSPPQPTWEDQSSRENPELQQVPVSLDQANSLDSIAADLNLSASARRQLLGRNQRDSKTSSIKITNFNTDQEYAANEALRQTGEIVQHNAVRGIAPGKHSLKQLVNAATTQKDALEEQFAAGRRNKSEAGARYGW